MTPTTGPPVAVLDANVLYPQWLRDVMLTLAAEGSFQPAWSRQIIDEMRRNVLRNHPEIDPDRFDAVTVGTLHRRARARPDHTQRADVPHRVESTTEARTVGPRLDGLLGQLHVPSVIAWHAAGASKPHVGATDHMATSDVVVIGPTGFGLGPRRLG